MSRNYSPYDLMNLLDGMEVGEREIYHRGDFSLDRYRSKKLRTLADTVQLLSQHGYAHSAAEKLSENNYIYYIYKASSFSITLEIEDKITKLEEQSCKL